MSNSTSFTQAVPGGTGGLSASVLERRSLRRDLRRRHWRTSRQCHPIALKAALAVALACSQLSAMAQSSDPTPPKRPSEVYVPSSDLDAILGMEKRGVLLPRAQFEELLKKAGQNARETLDVPNGITVISADYQGRIVGSQLLVAATIKLNQVTDSWRFLRLPLAGVGLESASLDGRPALLGAKGTDPVPHLFSDHRGPHTLLFESAVPLAVSGGEREATFRLGDLPVGTLSLEVPANQRLLVGGRALERPSPIDKPATYSIAVGGSAEIHLKLIDRSLEQAADRLLFGTTIYRLNVSLGDAAWQAVTTLDARGTPVSKLSIGIPEGLRITTVTSTGLDSWKLAAAAPQKPATLELAFRQPFTGKRTIQFRGVLRPGADRRWRVESLKIDGATAHLGHIEIASPQDLRLRIDSTTNLRPRSQPVTTADATAPLDVTPPAPQTNAAAGESMAPAAPNARRAPQRPTPAPPLASLSYDAWNEQFAIAFGVEAKEREVLANLLTSLEIAPEGPQLQLAASLQSLNRPPFDIEITLPAEWTPTSVLINRQPVEWRELSAEAGTQHLLITLPRPAAPGQPITLALNAQKSVSNWPIDETGIELPLPEVRILKTAAVAGTYLIRAGDDFELTPSDIKGLDPAHLNLPRERIGFRYQDTRFSGKLKIARRPARLSADTLLVVRLDRAALRTGVRTAIEARGGGFRRLDVFLPESAGKDIRFRTDAGEVALADQSVSEPVRGERHWMLTFERYVQGAVHLSALIEAPRGNAAEFRVPEPRLAGVARHSGIVVVRAAPDQQLHVTATGADNQPLTEVDQADLPSQPADTDDRTVAAYRFVQPDNRVTLTESRYAPVGVARAVCMKCEIQTIVPVSGECQHTARLQFLATGVQSLRLTLPEGADLWATLIDGEPVEVRRGQSGYELPLKPASDPEAPRELTLFYATKAPAGDTSTADQSRAGDKGDKTTNAASDAVTSVHEVSPDAVAARRFQQAPPVVSVVGNSGAAERMEMLHQSWTLHYSPDLAVRQSWGAFSPDWWLADRGVLSQLVQDLGDITAVDAGWKLLEFLGVVVLIWLCVRGYERWGAGGIISACVVVAIIACVWLSTMAFSSRENQSAAKRESSAKSAADTTAFAHAYQWNRAVEPEKKSLPFPLNLKARSGKAMRGDLGGGFAKQPSDRLEVKSDESANNPFDGPAAAPPPQAPAAGEAPPRQQAAPAPAPPKVAQPGARLSVAIAFDPPADSHHRTFEYLGRDPVAAGAPLLDVEFESVTARRVFSTALAALVTLVFWLLRRRTWAVKGTLAAFGLLVPIALAAVVPISVEVWLEGIFLGAACGTIAWLIYQMPNLGRGRSGRADAASKNAAARPLGAAGTAVLLAAAIVGAATVARGDDQTPEAKTAGPIVIPRPQPPTGGAAIVPYDSDHDPLAAERVLLEQRAFLELWNRAHPEQPLDTHPAAEAFVTEALYTARVVEARDAKGTATADRGRVTVSGHIVLFSRSDRPLRVALPFQQAALQSAKLDGQPALLVPHPQPLGQKAPTQQYDAVLKTAGAHILDVELELPARVAGPSGEFTIGLLPVASGRFSFELPAGATSVRINGNDAGYRRRPDGGKTWIDVPIATVGQLSLAWQPAQEAGSVARSIESSARTLAVLDDAGLRTVSQFSLQVRQGGVSDLSFTLPAGAKLQTVRGSDVVGWKIEGNDPSRKLTVSLRRSVTGETGLELDLFQALSVNQSSVPVSVGLPAPLGVVRETGIIALWAGSQFDVRGSNLPGGTRVDAREFPLATFDQAGMSATAEPGMFEAAFRYNSRPAAFAFTLARRGSQTDVSALYAVLVGRRKQTLTTRFHIQPTGTALTQAQFRLPAGFLTLSVEGSPFIADWYVSGVAGAKNLVVEFASPQSSPFDLAISGTVAKNPDDAKTTLDVPTLTGARRAESRLAVWLDGSYQATIGEAADWKSIGPNEVPSDMKSLLHTPPQFAFESRRSEPAAVSLDLAHAVARLSGDSATIVTVTNAAVFYTVALHWNITQATADTFVLTMPDWVASRLDLTDPHAESAANPRRRETVSTTLPNGRVRWAVELQEPVADQLFLTATAVLPLPKDGKIVAPTIGFESEESSGAERRFDPLATQRHFVVLVNQSAAQLTEAAGNPIEVVERSSLPIQLDAQLLREAMLVGRLTRSDVAATWRLDRPAVRRGPAAFVNLADLITVLEHGGSWRTQATYRVKNVSRQFLPVEIPEQSEILSVVVKDKPARPVRATIGGKALNLIPLPEASEGDLSFDVKLIVAGKLPGGSLPQGLQLAGQQVALVAPQVVSGEGDADFGIPVARTRWTVWLPDDERVRVLTSAQDTNLERADEASATLLERSALVDEAKQLLSVIESNPYGNSTDLAVGNLSKINSRLNSESQGWGGKPGWGGNAGFVSQDEWQREQSVKQQIEAVEKQQSDSKSKPASKESADKTLTPESQAAQARDLFRMNEAPGEQGQKGGGESVAVPEFRFQTESKDDGKSPRRARAEELRQGKDKELAYDLVDDATVNSKKDEKQSAPQSGLGQFGAPIFSSTPGAPHEVAGNADFGFPIVQGPSPQLGPSGNGDLSRPHSAGTLSLAFDIPQEGQMLVFTKAGGDPKLAFELRPQKSYDLLFGALWTLPWLFLLLLATRSSAPAARRQLPYALVALGLVLFVLLPLPLGLFGLLFVVVGTIWVLSARQRSTVGG
jgi:hypothetical protein